MKFTPSCLPGSRQRATAIPGFLVLALILGAPARPDTPTHKSPMSEATACSLLKKAVAKVEGMSLSAVREAGWHCDVMSGEGLDPSLFVIQIRAKCTKPEGCGSTLIGLYAVEKSTGRVGEYDGGRNLMIPLD